MKESLCLENKVIIRIAKPNDLPVLFLLVDSYSEEMQIDKTKVKNCIREIVYNNTVMLFTYQGNIIGAIAGFILPSMYNDDVLYCESFFYVRPRYRNLTKEILNEIELVLLPTVVTNIVMGIPDTPVHDKYKRFLKMNGFRFLETHMSKRISN